MKERPAAPCFCGASQLTGGVDTHVWYCPQAVRNYAKAVQLRQTARLISRKLPLRS